MLSYSPYGQLPPEFDEDKPRKRGRKRQTELNKNETVANKIIKQERAQGEQQKLYLSKAEVFSKQDDCNGFVAALR